MLYGRKYNKTLLLILIVSSSAFASSRNSVSDNNDNVDLSSTSSTSHRQNFRHSQFRHRTTSNENDNSFSTTTRDSLELSAATTTTTNDNVHSTSSSVNQEEHLRKELIKLQILQRLGLNEKPNVDSSHKISRDLVLETLRRTEASSLSSIESTANILKNSHNLTFTDSSSSTSTSNSEDGNYAKTSEIISFPDKGPILNGHNLLSFSYAGNHAYGVGLRIKKANLWVKMDYRSSIGRHFGRILHPRGITLYVFQVQGNFSSNHHSQQIHLNSQDVSLELVVSRTLSLDNLGWQKLDITTIVSKWYAKQNRHRVRHAHNNNHREKLTILVDCSGCGTYIKPIIFKENSVMIPDSSASGNNNNSDDNQNDSENTNGFMNDSNDNLAKNQNQHSLISNSMSSENELVVEGHVETLHFSQRVDNLTEIPFLVLETESAPNFKRSRRRALECSPRTKHCCKQRFYISFEELGWSDWIIAPRGYFANYCRGSCGGLFRTPDTYLSHHTHVIEEYRRTLNGQVDLSGLRPCCSPTKFASMSLIYFGPEMNIIKRDLPRMIVEECGCP